MKWLILLFGILTNASASVLIKIATMAPRKLPSVSDPIAALLNWPFWLGLGLYGIAFALYAAALSRFPMNVAHPILTSGSVVMVALFSLFFLREPFHWTTGVGIVLVAGGVVLLTVRIV